MVLTFQSNKFALEHLKRFGKEITCNRELIIIVGEAQSACGIKWYTYPGLFGGIGRPPIKQSALLDNFKFEAEHRLGYFFAQKRTAPRCRHPTNLDTVAARRIIKNF